MAKFTLSGLASELSGLTAGIPAAIEPALEKAALVIETEAKSYPGTYTAGWPSLADSTIAQKKTGDSPELETGELRDSIAHEVQGHKAFVGSNLATMKYAEFGTSRIPPRPILSAAAITKENQAVQAFADEITARTGLGIRVMPK